MRWTRRGFALGIRERDWRREHTAVMVVAMEAIQRPAVSPG
jgi:hypothetical protein